MERTKEENKALCERYPFLIPWNCFSGMLITEAQNGGYYLHVPDKIPEYDYEFTLLDSMPEGWQKAFGIQMCEEIRDALIEDGDLDTYRVVQIKEKYGGLRWYDTGVKVGSRVHDIIRKYENLSTVTCIVCGKPATRVTIHWISPFCDDCCINCGNGRSVSVEEFYRDVRRETEDGKDNTGSGMDG